MKPIERLINLLAFLLTAGRPVTADEIRHTVAGYGSGGDEAYRRMFERDKDLLRRIGIPLRTVALDRWEVEQGYAVSPAEYRLKDPELTDDERAALWLAAQIVRVGGHTPGSEAILKLGGTRLTSGVEPVAADLGDSRLLADLYLASTERRVVDLTYRGRLRSVEPYGIGHRRGHWYLVAVEGEETRVYRLDRIEQAKLGAAAQAFVRRPEVDVRAALATHPWEAGSEPPTKVLVRFDPEVAWWAVRRLGERADTDPGTTEVELSVNHLDAFLGWVLSFGDQAEVVGPPEVRQALVDRVTAAARAGLPGTPS